MNVIITIKGREAVPVRAIPLLTDWEVLSPDELAQALTSEDVFAPQFKNLRAYRLDGNFIKAVNPNWWANFPVRELKALSDRIGHGEITHETGYDEWRPESLRKLPAGVFLWRNEFEGCFWRKFGPNGETVVFPSAGGVFERRRRNESIQLDFDPFIPDAEISKLVMEGFAEQPLQPEPQAEARAVSAAGGARKIWTPERKAEARAYRAQHGLKKTAEFYGVSQATISRHIPATEVKPAGHSVFTHYIK